jgi:uncharacterized membrane protein
MFKLLRKYNRLNETLFLGCLSILCFAISVFRFLMTGSMLFLFLNWNLFLAFIPWFFSSLITIKPRLQKNKIAVVIFLFSWLLFFPNAPYILTDLFHLRSITTVPVWFDLMLILSFAWTGLLFGFMSLWDIEQTLGKQIKEHWMTIISIGLLFLASFGVYIGRYLRWNSWDIIRDPFGLLSDIGDRFFNPSDHPQTWGMTMFMGLFLTIIYLSFKLIKKRNELFTNKGIVYEEPIKN